MKILPSSLVLLGLLGSVAPVLADVYVVSNTNDNLQTGTLRTAITLANQHAGPDTIKFAIATGSQNINLTSALPAITEQVLILGNTQPGFAGKPLIVLNGTGVGMGGVGLVLSEHQGSVIRGLVIQQFATDGIQILGGGEHLIVGNYLGTDQAGVLARGNGEGIYVNDSDNVTIGGSKTGEGNLISANNGPGIYVRDSDGCHVYGNIVGTDRTGGTALGNDGNGISILDGSGHEIGGTKPGQGNLSSGNGTHGIILNEVTETIIAGNRLGTDATGKSAVPNSNGIRLVDCSLRVGGMKPGARNLISGNSLSGIEITGGTDTDILGNYIGVDISGAKALGNSGDGINASDISAGITIGAANAGKNVIAANEQDGINLNNVDGALIYANRIGVNAKGKAMGNGGTGILLATGSQNARVGRPGKANLIAHNGAMGVYVSGDGSTGNTISANKIFGNADLGISLYSSIPRLNDTLDPDSGGNNFQNHVLLTKALSSGKIAGTLNSNAFAEYRIEFFSAASPEASNRPQGKKLLGAVTTTADGLGNATFKTTVAPITAASITATATNTSTGDTSEFSPGLVVSK